MRNISSVAILSSFHFSLNSKSSLSLSTPIKFVPLSDQIIACVSLQEANRSTPFTKELVSVDGKTEKEETCMLVSPLRGLL